MPASFHYAMNSIYCVGVYVLLFIISVRFHIDLMMMILSIELCPVLDDFMDQVSPPFLILYSSFQLFYALYDVSFDGV